MKVRITQVIAIGSMALLLFSGDALSATSPSFAIQFPAQGAIVNSPVILQIEVQGAKIGQPSKGWITCTCQSMGAQKLQSIKMVCSACPSPRASTPSSWNSQAQRMKGCYPRRAWPSRCDNLSNTEPERIQRHNRAVRLAHGANAVAMIVLIATGLALGDDISPVLVAALGGHAVANEMHRLGGMAFAVALLLAAGLFHSPTRGLVRDLVYFRQEERRWPQAFLKCILSPAHGHTAFHNGRFDPAQRLILLLLLCSTALVAATGVYLYILPAAPQWVFLVAIRIHIYGAWIAIIALCLHAFAGLGVLHTHCGLLGAMFGDGTVPIQTARTLWPGWTQNKLHDLEGDSHGPPSHTPS